MKSAIQLSKERIRCRKKFLRFFPGGYSDEKYISWERNYKWQAHISWKELLNRAAFDQMLKKNQYELIANTAVRIETKTNLLFSFEKMALRDAVKSANGARAFAKGLYNYIYGASSKQQRFEEFGDVLGSLPRIQTRVHTWPLHTVFGFIANPRAFIFLKPKVTKIAAINYGFDFDYHSRPNWNTYHSLLDFADQVNKDTTDLQPKDYIDLQSFIWVQGSEEY